MRIIGVTGGIGSGKSTVSRVLKDLGAKIIDADKVAREIVYKGGKVLDELTAFFGNEILDESDGLNRKKLGEIVFNNPEKLEVLNQIMHKHIVDRIVNDLNTAKSEGKWEIIVIDAPIPLEHGFIDLVDEVWVVVADKETRIKRVMDRSGLTYEEALSRINSQLKDEEYSRIADEIIVNDGAIEDLEKSVVKLFINARTSR